MSQDSSFAGNNDGAGSLAAGGVTTEAQAMLESFWAKAVDEIKHLTNNDFKNQELPLARIKKIMKLDDDVKTMVSRRVQHACRAVDMSLTLVIRSQMISAEAPVLFAKAAEIFITELSLRAWIHTEDNKRRTLQRNDIAMAITKYDQFDFLIDIVPRDELKPASKRAPTNPSGTAIVADAAGTAVNPDQVQYYLQLAQQAALQQGAALPAGQPIQILQPNALQGVAPGSFTIANSAPQIVQVQMPNVAQQANSVQTTTDNGQAPTTNQNSTTSQGQVIQIQQPAAAGGQAVPGQIQLLSQPMLASNGEGGVLQLTPQQLQQLRVHLQGQNIQQPIILQAPGLAQPGAQYQLNPGQFITQTLVPGPAAATAVPADNNEQLEETSE